MSKADRSRRESARERIAAQQAAARKAESRRRVLIAGGSTLVVIVIVAVLIIVKLSSGSPSDAGAGSPVGTALPASVNAQITGVPAAVLAKVGAGAASPGSIKAVTDTPLTSNGKPEVLYIGAEFCPFCATERWAMAVALSRFGTFSPLHGIHSSATDQPASIPTVTFYKSTYTSKYLTFSPVETTKVDRTQTLQTPTTAQASLWKKYTQDGIPFVDFANRYVISGVTYSYQVLQGKTWAQIAAALQDPSTDIAQGADGAANQITAAICRLTSNQPAAVCGTPLITSLQAKL